MTVSDTWRLPVHQINPGRKGIGLYHTLVAELREENAESIHKQYLKMKKRQLRSLAYIDWPIYYQAGNQYENSGWALAETWNNYTIFLKGLASAL